MQNRENTNLRFKELLVHIVDFLYMWLRRTLLQTADGSVRLLRGALLLLVALLVLPTLLMLVVFLFSLTLAQLFGISVLLSGWITMLFFVGILILLYVFRKPLMAPLGDKVLLFFMNCDARLKQSMDKWNENNSASSDPTISNEK